MLDKLKPVKVLTDAFETVAGGGIDLEAIAVRRLLPQLALREIIHYSGCARSKAPNKNPNAHAKHIKTKY